MNFLLIFGFILNISIMTYGEVNELKSNLLIIQEKESKMQSRAYFGAGCFWGVEALFQDLDGVVSTTVGYMNGHTEDPTYEKVCYTDTGHAEVVEVVYNSKKISFASLCRYFWRLHDPTTLNRQGPDIGSQYRSGIYVSNKEEKEIAETIKVEMQQYWKDTILTEIVTADRFYEAEIYHQDYFKNRGINHSGCHFLRSWD